MAVKITMCQKRRFGNAGERRQVNTQAQKAKENTVTTRHVQFGS